MPNCPSRAQSAFLRIVERPFCERAALLEAECGDDAALRRRVEALLAAHESDDSLLDHPRTNFAAVGAIPCTELGSCEPTVGEKVGVYTLLQKLGEGGMGAVWAAEQHGPVRRRVALKLIKAGMDSAQVLRRFEAERQALALMDHTNIAKVFDAGTTPEGRPFFAMELVKGVPITKYCDDLSLSVRDRLELFCEVCRAIQHAHQKGVIHRDIKPSNVLVCIQDGRPVPKVIDFGVAKALHQRLTERTMYTEIGAVIGTLEYMAPEQAELSALDVDTRADVYGLGALLYELLTGTTPLDRRRLTAVGMAEMMRMIREDEPPRPSTRLTGSTDTVAAVAVHRRTEPGRLTREVRGDLDWIVMKCLEKDRTRRYETAIGIARDLERHLIDEPIEARPPSQGYRLKKLARRNKRPLAVAAFVVIALISGSAVATWQAVRATRAESLADRRYRDERNARTETEAARREAVAERTVALAERARAEEQTRLAQAEAVKADAVLDLMTQMLLTADAYYGRGGEYTVRQMLDDFTARLDGDLAARFQERPAVEAEVRRVLGRAYAGLLMPEKAGPQLERAEELLRRAPDDDGESLAATLAAHAYSAFDQGDFVMAERRASEALELLDRRGADTPEATEVRADALVVLQDALHRAGRFEESDEVGRRGLELTETRSIRHRPAFLRCLSHSSAAQMRFDEAEQFAGEAVRLSERADPDSADTGWSLMALAHQSFRRGELTEAESQLRRIVTIFERQFGADHRLLDGVRDLLGSVLAKRGDAEGSRQLREESLASAERRAAASDDPAESLRLAELYGEAGRVQDALATLGSVAETAKRDPVLLRKTAQCSERIAFALLWRMRDPAAAELVGRAALRTSDSLADTGDQADEIAFADLLHRLAESLLELKRPHDALPFADRDVAVRRRWSVRSGWARYTRAQVLWEVGRRDEAVEDYRAALRDFLDQKDRFGFDLTVARFMPRLRTGGGVPADVIRDSWKQIEAGANERIAADRGDAAAWGWRVEAFVGQNQWGDATAAFEEAVRHGDRGNEYWNYVALQIVAPLQISSEAARFAVTVAERVVAAAPNDAKFRRTLGAARYHAGDWARAVEDLRTSDDPVAGRDLAFPLAIVHHRLGDDDEARRWHALGVLRMTLNARPREDLQRLRAEAENLFSAAAHRSPVEALRPVADIRPAL